MLIHDFVDGQYFLEGITASEKKAKKKHFRILDR